MKILFAFENTLSSREADAEVFTATARYLSLLASTSWLHVPMSRPAENSTEGTAKGAAAGDAAGPAVIRAYAPVGPAFLRHFCCGLTLVFRKEFQQADLIYTRNLWIAWMAMMCGQRVAFDHYRPWADQIPPLQPWIRALIGNPRFLVNICHSDYTKDKYIELGAPESKVHCIRNGFEPQRLRPTLSVAEAKRRIGVPAFQKTVIYTGRLNHKKGLGLLIEAARRLPHLRFILVGSSGDGPIEDTTRDDANIQIVPWQDSDGLANYIYAADVLLIPPSRQPLAKFGSTVLPLKLFLYMASGRPILAGDTADVREMLEHGRNAFLCDPDDPQALADGLATLTGDEALARRLGTASQADSGSLTWEARARRIASVLASRLDAAPASCVAWDAAQSRAWIGRSWRWLIHLTRERSWILPPSAVPAIPTAKLE